MRGSLPIYLVMKGRKCLVIGGGDVAKRKVATLLEYTDGITVISPEICREIETQKDSGRVLWINRKYKKGDLKGFDLVIAATDDQGVNEQIVNEADDIGVLLNVVDVPVLCNFYAASVISRGELQIAISTSGKSPAFSKLMRRYLEKKLEHLDDRILSRIQRFRLKLKELYPNDVTKRMRIMNSVVEKIDLDNDDLNKVEELINKVS